MTVAQWDFPIAHSSDADFRAWGANLSAKFAEVGLVRDTSQLNQINWTTVTRPGANTEAGYEMWFIPQPAVGTGPPRSFVMRVGYGTGNGTSVPGVWINCQYSYINILPGTDGTIAGNTPGNQTITCDVTSIQAPGTSRTSYMVYKDGFFAFFGYSGAVLVGGVNPVSLMAYILAPSVDTLGVVDGVGALGYYRPKLTTDPYARTAQYSINNWTKFTSIPDGSYGLVPQGDSGRDYGSGIPQVFVNWMSVGVTKPVMQVLATGSLDFALGAEFICTAVGTTPRKYKVMDACIVSGIRASAPAILWE